MGAAAVAALLRKERENITAFPAPGAASASSGKTIEALGIRDGLVLRRLRSRAVLREASNGGLYLDEPSWTALRALRKRLSRVLMSLAVVPGVITDLTFRR